MTTRDKPLVWMKGEVKNPPFTEAARIEAGVLLRRLQQGERLAVPHSRPMPDIGRRCHELRIPDEKRVIRACPLTFWCGPCLQWVQRYLTWAA